jgi:hypothetical protein
MMDQKQYDLSIKTLKTNFFETSEAFTLSIYIKQVHDCQVHFTETNFTASFYTKYEYQYFVGFFYFLYLIGMKVFLRIIQ